jgi:hypothetical protein
LEKKCANDIISGADGSFGLAVLLGSVGAGESVENAICFTEVCEIRVVKLFAIVALYRENRELKLGFNKSMKSDK